MTPKKPHLLIILDGWGAAPQAEGNAVQQARTPFLNSLAGDFPRTTLLCAGKAVGLPDGVMGNSEVGHLNIGAGRVVYQDIVRIDLAIQDNSLFGNPELNALAEKVKARRSALHLVGLLSDGGVHSHIRHLYALLKFARQAGIKRVYVHAILDGRDTAPDSGVEYVRQLQEFIRREQVGEIATICGRFYAMDRDQRWDRTQEAFLLYTQGRGIGEEDPVEAVKRAYLRNESDEFVRPVFLKGEQGQPLATVGEGDGLLFFNFRADRARQITRAFTDPDFSGFTRSRKPDLGAFVCMTLYDETFGLPVVFPPVRLRNILGEVVSARGLRQLRIAETEKYAHVTYFLNGGEETPFPMEDRCLIPSPRDIPTYDLKPEMSACQVADEVVRRLQSDRYDLMVINFANMDMVGHTGVLEAAVKAVETVDACMAKIFKELHGRGGLAMVTADHGNAEKMRAENGNPFTAHSLNPVPFILADESRRHVRLRTGGVLGDIAPTLLEIMGIAKPQEMTGTSLLAR